LEDLDEDQHHHDVHHGRVELEADVGGTNMEDHTEEALHMKIIIKTNTNHDVHHGRVELEADVGGTNMEDYAEEAMHMKIIIMNITIMIFIMVISNGRMML
jgi:hypothetical protein